MAVITPRVRWGSREVGWAYVPDTAEEVTHVARRMFAEGFGMAAFTFVAGSAILINGTTGGGLGILGMAAATGIAYAIIVSAFYGVSGGHINPAVTLGMTVAGRMPPSIAVLYGAAQFGGAVLGALLLEFIFRDIVADASGAASLALSADMDGWTGGLLEAVLTFLLVAVYFRAFVDPVGDRSTGAYAMGAVVLFGFLIAYPLTGAAMNVARVFGTGLVANEWTDFAPYLLGLAGGAVAGLLHQYIFTAEEEM